MEIVSESFKLRTHARRTLKDSYLTRSEVDWIMALHDHFYSIRSERHEV